MSRSVHNQMTRVKNTTNPRGSHRVVARMARLAALLVLSRPGIPFSRNRLLTN